MVRVRRLTTTVAVAQLGRLLIRGRLVTLLHRHVAVLTLLVLNKCTTAVIYWLALHGKIVVCQN